MVALMMSRKTKNKTMNAGLALMMGVAALTPVMAMDAGVASAAESGFSGGMGLASDPYVVSTPAELNLIRNFPASHFVLANDIDLTGQTWIPIAMFNGSIDGAGHTINGLTIKPSVDTGFIAKSDVFTAKNLHFTNVSVTGGSGSTGVLVGEITGATSKNSTIEGVSVVGGTVSGGEKVGGIIGMKKYSSNRFYLSKSFTDNVTVTGGKYTGGIAGYVAAADYLTVSEVFTTGPVTGIEMVGGLFGYFSGAVVKSSISDSYSLSDVTATITPIPGNTGSDVGAGGLVGAIRASIHRSYALGDVTSKSRSGGLIGSVTLASSNAVYSDNFAMNLELKAPTVGNIVGYHKYNPYDSPFNVNNQYFDDSKEPDGITQNYVNLLKADTYKASNFDIGGVDSKWSINEGSSLPYLTFAPQITTYDVATGKWKSKLVSEGADSGGGALPEDGSTSGGKHDQNATLLLNGGSLTLDAPAITPMGLIKLKPQAQTVRTGFTDSFGVVDARGTGEGWRLAVNATPFEVVEPETGFVKGTSAHALPAGTLTLKPLAGIERQGVATGAEPTSQMKMDSIIDSGAVTVANANVNEGMGDFKLSFAEDALGLIIDSATAKIDKVNYPDSSTPYESTVTWTLVTGP